VTLAHAGRALLSILNDLLVNKSPKASEAVFNTEVVHKLKRCFRPNACCLTAVVCSIWHSNMNGAACHTIAYPSVECVGSKSWQSLAGLSRIGNCPGMLWLPHCQSHIQVPAQDHISPPALLAQHGMS